jgi:hypothetical protein
VCISGTEALSFLKFLFPKVFRDNSLYFQIYCGFTLTLTITINLYIYVYLSSNCSKEINVFFNNNSDLGLLAYIYISLTLVIISSHCIFTMIVVIILCLEKPVICTAINRMHDLYQFNFTVNRSS